MLVPRTKSTRLVLPRGVAGSTDEPADADEGTLSYDSATGLIRIKTSAGWVDATGGGGGGGVTSFNARTGVVVPVAGDYTKADVGLSNVTNDPQWASTLSNQIGALAAKSSLDGADAIPVEDSTAGNGKKKVSPAAIAEYVSTYQGVLTSMWLAPPATPGSLNDEFTYGTSPDLAARGWDVRNDAGFVMTRVGDVTINYPGTLTSVQYRSTMLPGGLAIQSVSKLNAGKAVTGSWSFTCDMRASHLNTDGSYFYEAPLMWDVTSPKLDNTMRRVYIGNFGGNRFGQNMNITQSYPAPPIGNVSSNYPVQPWVAWLDWNQTTNNWRGTWADPVADRIIAPNMSVNNFVFTLRCAGFALQTARVWSNSWVVIRSFRQGTQDKMPFIP